MSDRITPIAVRTSAGTITRRMPRALREAERTAREAAAVALRRVGCEAWEYGRTSGRRIDTRTLAARAALPAARVFGARDHGRMETPDASLLLIVDASGSMFGARPCAPSALAVARGITLAAEEAAVPVTMVTHDEACGSVRLVAWERVSDALGARCDAEPMKDEHAWGNYDAPAVSRAWQTLAPLARRRAAVLICDGMPVLDDHRRYAVETLAMIRRAGGAFAFAAVTAPAAGEDAAGARQWARQLAANAAADWGASRCAPASNPRALAQVIVRAIGEVRGSA